MCGNSFYPHGPRVMETWPTEREPQQCCHAHPSTYESFHDYCMQAAWSMHRSRVQLCHWHGQAAAMSLMQQMLKGPLCRGAQCRHVALILAALGTACPGYHVQEMPAATKETGFAEPPMPSRPGRCLVITEAQAAKWPIEDGYAGALPLIRVGHVDMSHW